MTADITNSAAATCIEITSKDVVFEGGGYTVDGQDTSGTTGVYVYNSSTTLTNVTIQGIRVTDWRYGIYYRNVQNGSIANSTTNSNLFYGMFIDTAHYNNITNNTVSENDQNGMWIDLSNNNNITGNNFRNNTYEGVLFWESSNNGLINNTATLNRNGFRFRSSSNDNTVNTNNVTNNNEYGIWMDPTNNIFFDNLFNNTANLYLSSSTNTWNTTKQAGTNIKGGPNLGGNLWAYPNGTGFSLECNDLDSDGICDSSLTMDSGNVDHLPIALVIGQDFTPPQVTDPHHNLTGVIDSTRVFHLNVTVTDTPAGVDRVLAGNAINHTMINIGGDVYAINTTLQALGCTTTGACIITIYANDTMGNMNHTATLSITHLANQPGWPVSIGKTLTSVTVADIDANTSNGLEIVLGSGITDPSGRGQVRAFHFDNSSASGWPKELTSSGEVLSSLPTVGDLFGNGVPVVIALSTAGKMYAWYGNGTSLWTINMGASSSSTPLIADIDDDLSNGREIVVGADDSKVHMFYSNGTEFRTISAGGKLTSSPSVGDIDADGDLEIVIGSYDYKVYAWHHDGVPVTGWPRTTNNFVTSSPALCDLDGDGLLDVAVGSDSNYIYAFKGDGTNLSGSWPVATGGQIVSSPSCGDINGDGANEIAVGSYDNKIYVLYGNGTTLWEKDVGAPVSSSPALGDIDGDSDIEIIVGTRSTSFVALHHNGSYVLGWPATGDGQFLGSPAIADIDGDNRTEIVVTTSVGSIYVWDTNSSFNASNVPWAMFGKDPGHTGSASPQVKVISPPSMGFRWINEDSAFLLNISKAVFPSGSQVIFNASAYDPTSTISSYRWSSNLDGLMGTGQNITNSSLRRGTHDINLSATTASGGRGYGFTRVFIYTGTVSFSDDTPLFDINSTTGIISFTPDNSQVGNYTVNITMTDGGGYLGSVVFSLMVFNTNDAPVINTTSPPTFVNEDDIWYYDFNASDDDLDAGYGDSLSWEVNNTNMTWVDPVNGKLMWMPDRRWAGVNHTFNITVTDSSGATGTLQFNVYVNRTNSLLVVYPQKDRDNYYQNDNVTLKAKVYDFYGANKTVDTVTAVIEKPCGSTDNVTLSHLSDNIYQGIYSGAMIPGDYLATIYADGAGFFTGTKGITFQVSSPASWTHYMNITVGAGASDRSNASLELYMNFTQVLETLGLSGRTFDNYSIRLYETDPQGGIIKEVPYQFARYKGDPQSTNIAQGKYVWEGPLGHHTSPYYPTGCGGSSNYDPENAVDNNLGTRWGGCICGPGTACFTTYNKIIPAGIGIDLGAEVFFFNISMDNFYKDSWILGDYTISVSSDNTTWTTIVNETGNDGQVVSHYPEFISGRYLWLNVTRTKSTNTYLITEEIMAYEYLNVYNATNNAHGNLTWVMDGTTSSGTDRYYQLRFGTREEGEKAPPVHNVNYSGYSHTSGLSVTIYNASNNTIPSVSVTGNTTPLRHVNDTFNASASSDADSDQIYYYWNFGECRGGVGQIKNYSFTVPGTKNVTLTIWDSKGGMNQTNLSITVSNIPPVLDPIGYLNGKEDSYFYYDVNASDIDNASGLDTFTFSSNSTIFIVNSSTGIISFTPNRSTVGNHTINITVSDGYLMDYEVIPFRVNLTYHVPNLSFIEGKTAVENQTMSFYVNATDIDLDYGDSLTFSYNCTYPVNCNVSFNITKLDNTSALVDWTPLEVTKFGNSATHIKSGLHWINFTVRDLQNLTGNQMFPLAVLNDTNSPPLIVDYAPSNYTTINESETLTFFVNATDPDTGTVPTIYLYRNGTIMNYSITNVLNYTWATNYADAGEFYIEAAVTDGINSTVQDHFYTVRNVNRPPNITITSPSNMSRYAGGSAIVFSSSIHDLDNESMTYGIKIDGTQVSNKGNLTYLWPYSAAGSVHIINFTAYDGIETSYEKVYVNVLAELNIPAINLTNPLNNTNVSLFNNSIVGAVSDDTEITNVSLFVNGAFRSSWGFDGNFSRNFTFVPGAWNNLTVEAMDVYNNNATKTVRVFVTEPGIMVTSNATANTTLVVNETLGATSTELLFFPLVGGEVNVTINATMNVSEVESGTSNTNFSLYALAQGQTSIGKFVRIDVSGALNESTNFTSVLLRMYYAVADLDSNGDGDTEDPGDIDPLSLRFYRYCNASGVWNVVQGQTMIICGNDTISVYGSGVNRTMGYVWANLSRLSTYGVGGSLISAPISPTGGGDTGYAISIGDIKLPGSILPGTRVTLILEIGSSLYTRMGAEVIIQGLPEGWGDTRFWTGPLNEGTNLVEMVLDIPEGATGDVDLTVWVAAKDFYSTAKRDVMLFIGQGEVQPGETPVVTSSPPVKTSPPEVTVPGSTEPPKPITDGDKKDEEPRAAGKFIVAVVVIGALGAGAYYTFVIKGATK